MWWICVVGVGCIPGAIATFEVIQGLRLPVVFEPLQAFRVLEIGLVVLESRTPVPGFSGSKRGHRTWLDERLGLFECVVVLDQDWQMVFGIAIPMAEDGFDLAGR